MHPLTQNDARTAEIAKIAETEEDITALRGHLTEVIEGAAFKGSHRSGQFLKYIVEQSIAGHFESLKERVIGVELFGRSTSYDTGDDAIVRVTASDVRKRLLQHYGRYGTTSAFRISLPLGSYIPEITRDPHPPEVHTTPPVAPPPDPAAAPGTVAVVSPVAPTPETPEIKSRLHFRWLYVGIFLVVLNVIALGVFWTHFSRTETAANSTLPWSVFFNSPHATQLITSDPNIAEIQGFTGEQISVSDYANHNYIPAHNTLSPEAERFCRVILRGDKAASVDTPIAVNVAELAQASSRNIIVHGARSIQLADLQTEDNLILLGSPRSNPWTALYNDQLDFRFVFDKASGQEIINNVHPRPGERSSYVPTAPGWATGQSFATISFVQNPDQNSQVLLLSGANGEGTEAAGKIITDLPRLAATLKKCGISSSGPVQHFELLLHLNTMAGSPSNVDVLACHILPGNSAH
jgi:hypothetical protein